MRIDFNMIESMTFPGMNNGTGNRKTIYTDIKRLQAYGMKIAQTKGSSFGYYVEKRDFDLAELKLLVDAIHEAIQNNRQIGFKYCEWTVRKELVQKKSGAEYIVSPWALTWDDENYYMAGKMLLHQIP